MRKWVYSLTTATAVVSGMILGVGPTSTASAATSSTPIYLNRAYSPTVQSYPPAQLVGFVAIARFPVLHQPQA